MSLQGLKYVVSGPREGRLDVINLMCYASWHIRIREAVALDGVKCQ
jgi:hypothetical protein